MRGLQAMERESLPKYQVGTGPWRTLNAEALVSEALSKMEECS
jgi:hypothetical protein